MAEGADLVSWARYIKTGGVFGILANKGAGITKITDLKGRKIGIIGTGSSTYSVSKVLLAENGMSEADVEFVSLGCCTAQYNALLDRKVDAIGTWNIQIAQIKSTAEQEGKKDFLDQLVYFDGASFLGDIYVSSRDYYEKNKDVLTRYLRAIQRGQRDMVANPSEALTYAAKHIENFNLNDPANRQLIEIQNQMLVIDGLHDYTQIAKSLDVYFKVGLIKTDPKTLDLKKLFPNDIPEAAAKKG